MENKFTSERLLSVAKDAATGASQIIKNSVGTDQTIKDKISRFDIVTQVDLDSEKEILSVIQKNFAEHSILSEENGMVGKKSVFTWVIDPLDGTSLFTAGIPEYCVSIGLLKDNHPFLGVISKVATNEMYWATKGSGAFKDGKPVHVSRVSEYSQAIIASDYQNTEEQRVKDHERNGGLMMGAQKFRTGLGTVNSLTEVVEGKTGGFVNYCKPWDFAAGAILVVEAGGKATDWKGEEIDWTNEWIEGIFSNGLLHNQILKIVADKN